MVFEEHDHHGGVVAARVRQGKLSVLGGIHQRRGHGGGQVARHASGQFAAEPARCSALGCHHRANVHGLLRKPNASTHVGNWQPTKRFGCVPPPGRRPRPKGRPWPKSAPRRRALSRRGPCPWSHRTGVGLARALTESSHGHRRRGRSDHRGQERGACCRRRNQTAVQIC